MEPETTPYKDPDTTHQAMKRDESALEVKETFYQLQNPSTTMLKDAYFDEPNMASSNEKPENRYIVVDD